MPSLLASDFHSSINSKEQFRSSHRRCSGKEGVLRNFVTGKHPCQRLFFNKVACNFIKKESQAQVFSCGFCEISKNAFFTERTSPDDWFW